MNFLGLIAYSNWLWRCGIAQFIACDRKRVSCFRVPPYGSADCGSRIIQIIVV